MLVSKYPPSIEVKSFHNQHIAYSFYEPKSFIYLSSKRKWMPIKKKIKEDMDDKIRRKPKYAIHKYEMEESDFIIYLT